MSRHRNVRSMNYSDEYDGYDDVYGHSVEDDYSISPSSAAFMYDRSRPYQVSAFLNTQGDIAEEEEEEGKEETSSDSEINTRNKLNELEESKLRSCLDEVRSVVGDTVQDNTLVDAILSSEFDLTRALNKILNLEEEPKKPSAESPKPQRTGFLRNRTAGPVENLSPASEKQPSSIVRTVTPTKQVLGFDVPPDVSKSGNATPVTQSPMQTRKLQGEANKTDSAPDETKNISVRKNLKNAEEEYKKERSNTKESLNLVVIGHVDAGKSTLMGHLLLDLGMVSSKLMHKYEQESRKLGKQSFVYAWILDETGEERNRGITMDVGQSKIETESKVVCVLDAPGHKDFIPNMITGASQADVALLVVDSTRGEFETGFGLGGQTREHTLLVRSLGVSQLCVVVNKLDTVGWSMDRFNEISTKLCSFLRQVGFKDKDVVFVPCSGLSGVNLTKPPAKDCKLSEWYTGPTLIQVIDQFHSPERPVSKPLRLSVNDVYKGTGSGFCISGRVETGFIQQNEKVLVLPQNEAALVKGITMDEMPCPSAFAGDYVNITLANYDQQNMSVGYILCDPSTPVPVSCCFEARIVIFNTTHPITKGCPVVLHMQFLAEQAIIKKLISEVSKGTGEVVKKKPRCLVKGSSAIVRIEVTRPICMELYKDIKELGRFMLRVGGVTIAAGLITAIL